MDELVHYCLRQLSFDGDFGSDVSRLRDFALEFYTHCPTQPQNLDDKFYAFVWSLVVQQPTVRVGTIPLGVSSDVYIAPQTSAKRKAKAKGEEHVETTAPTLDIIADAKLKPLDDLKREYGDNLRIAVDPDALFAAITGSHIRSSKLSPMVYSALQIITRGRDHGTTVVELGQKSKYDQKTCFYLVKQLIELDLVVKVRKGGIGTHFCIHKYFFDRNTSWKEIRDEENLAEDVHKAPLVSQPEQLDDSNGLGNVPSMSPDFSPIDARHLASLPLVRARVIKLLKASRNHMHASNNMLMSIGFKQPKKADRRCFHSRIRELLKEGVIEKVVVPSNSKKSITAETRCFRLVTTEIGPAANGEALVVQPVDDDDKDDGLDDPLEEPSGVKANITIHKQIVNLLEDSGTTGMTLNELSTALCNFDKRTVELLLTRAERYPPAPHLQDLGVVALMETHGRERRNRYLTVASYRILVAKENLDKSIVGLNESDLANTGGFSRLEPDLFYGSQDALYKYQDSFKDEQLSKKGGKSRKYPLKNPLLPDGNVKQGRPRKKKVDVEGDGLELETKARRNKRKRPGDEECQLESAEGNNAETSSRPSKKRRISSNDIANEDIGQVNGHEVLSQREHDGGGEHSDVALDKRKRGRQHKPKPRRTESEERAAAVPKKRGRPSKQRPERTESEEKAASLPKKRGRPPKPKPEGHTNGEATASVPKKRGRPRKQIPVDSEGGLVTQRETAGSPESDDHLRIKRARPGRSPSPNTAVRVENEDHLFHSASPEGGNMHFSGGSQPLFEVAQVGGRASFEFIEDRGSNTVDSRQSQTPLSPIPIGSAVENPNMSETHEPSPDAIDNRTNSNFHANLPPRPAEDMRLVDDVAPVAVEDENLITPEDDLPNAKQLPSSTIDGSSSDQVVSMDFPIDPVLIADNPLCSNSTAINLPQGVVELSLMPPDAQETDSVQSQHIISSPSAIGQNGNLSQTGHSEYVSGTVPRSRPNVSAQRRENELFRVIQGFGGIVNTHTKEFYESHMALIELLTRNGEPASTPVGTRIDKRTVDATIAKLESRGRVKVLKTSMTSATGVSRPACLVYVPDLEQDKLAAALEELSRTFQTAPPQPSVVRKIDEPLEYGVHPLPQHSALPLQLLQMLQPSRDQGERWRRNTSRADQLFQCNDSTIHDVLITERTTVGQLSGFIVGRAQRAREFHLYTLQVLESRKSSPYIVSFDHRILALAYYHNDLPISTYCAVVSSLVHSQALSDLLSTENGRQTPVGSVSSSIHTMLQIGRSRARSRILDTLETLHALKLVSPLQPSESDKPLISCRANGHHPMAFDAASAEGWTATTPMSAPSYWQFHESAPLYLWTVSETSPPFLKDVPVASAADGVDYWQELERACNQQEVEFTPPTPSQDRTSLLDVPAGVAKSLRRPGSWKKGYVFTWHQIQYLKRFIDVTTGNTPLQSEDGGVAEIQKICWVVSAPQDAVEAFYSSNRNKVLVNLEKSKRQSVEEREKKKKQTKALLASKAAEAKIQREKDWENIVGNVYPKPLMGSAVIRVRRVRSRFLASGTIGEIQKWETEILDAVKEADIAAKQILQSTVKRQSKAKHTVAPPPLVSNPPEKSIGYLIEHQGPNRSLVQPTDKPKRKRRDTTAEVDMSVEVRAKSPPRRHRFHWNRDYDELARDACAVVRARCRGQARLDYSAFDQVFPSVPRNTVRQRLVHMRETPAANSYLNRLEDRWYELWVQHRGSALLPDDDPNSPSNFELAKHIEFLRNHIDKNALRVGFDLTQERSAVILPASINDVYSEWDVTESPIMAPLWDFMWNSIVDDNREKSLLQHPYSMKADYVSNIMDPSLEDIYLGEVALKMALGTSHEKYDAETASNVLSSVGEQQVSTAAKNLLSRGVLSKLTRDPTKPKPGRTLKISDINQNALGGSVTLDTFQDAAALEDVPSQQDGTWNEWPIIATDGDMAAIIQLVSENKVRFKVDTSQAQAARPLIDWNSKKADDDQLETTIQFRLFNLPSSNRQSPSTESSPAIVPVELEYEFNHHGKTANGGEGCCKKDSDGLVDCIACLEAESSKFMANLEDEDKELAVGFLASVQQAGPSGLSKAMLGDISAYPETVNSMVIQMTQNTTPLLFWVGYASVVLVSARFLENWTILVSESPRTRIFPRRWIDITGSKIISVWEAALRAVMGVVVFRPGISQAELRWRLRSVYDRQEINEVLCHLEEEGFLTARFDSRPLLTDQNVGVRVLDDEEERDIFWFLNDARRWYEVA